MFRGPVLLCLLALGTLATRSPAVELPVIVNGAQPAQPPKAETAPAKAPLPVIINYPSAALQPAEGRKSDKPLPVITNLPAGPKPAHPSATVRVVLPLDVAAFADDVDPVSYNVYPTWPVNGYYGAGWGWPNVGWPYAAGFGWYDWAGYGFGFGYPVAAYAAPLPWTPWGVGLVPPRVEVLDTGIRANVGHLASMPTVRAPVYGAVLGVYRVRR